MRVVRALLVGVGVLVVVIVASSASAFVHLATPLGREAARDTFVDWMSSRIRGRVEVGSFERMDPHMFVMTDFRVIAPDGEVVISTPRQSGDPEWGDLFTEGVFRMAPCTMERSTIRLTRGPDDQVNLVYAMEVPDDRWTLPVEMNQIRLVDQVMIVDLPGKPAITMRDVHGIADMHVGHVFEWRLFQNRGYVDLSPIHAGYRHMRGRLRSDHRMPLRVRMLVDLELAEPGIRLDYTAPRAIGRRGEPHFGVDLTEELGISDAEDDCAEGDLEECETPEQLRAAQREIRYQREREERRQREEERRERRAERER
jgi:hypothetical protein